MTFDKNKCVYTNFEGKEWIKTYSGEIKIHRKSLIDFFDGENIDNDKIRWTSFLSDFIDDKDLEFNFVKNKYTVKIIVMEESNG